jgi:hypothetical protein
VAKNCSAKEDGAPDELVEQEIEADPIAQVKEHLFAMQQELSNTRGFPLDERQQVFRDLQRKFHPDKNPNAPEMAKIVFQRLMEARRSYLAVR